MQSFAIAEKFHRLLMFNFGLSELATSINLHNAVSSLAVKLKLTPFVMPNPDVWGSRAVTDFISWELLAVHLKMDLIQGLLWFSFS